MLDNLEAYLETEVLRDTYVYGLRGQDGQLTSAAGARAMSYKLHAGGGPRGVAVP